jgi:hypothetical protein
MTLKPMLCCGVMATGLFARLNISPRSARMEQSFSPDGGKNWEVNWICELSRD